MGRGRPAERVPWSQTAVTTTLGTVTSEDADLGTVTSHGTGNAAHHGQAGRRLAMCAVTRDVDWTTRLRSRMTSGT